MKPHISHSDFADFTEIFSADAPSAIDWQRLPPMPGACPEKETALRIRYLREARGLTLAALADAVGVSKPTIWAWENGKAKPRPERIDSICQALGITRDELLRGEDGAAPPVGGHHNEDDRRARELLLQAGRQLVAQAWNVDVRFVRFLIVS